MDFDYRILVISFQEPKQEEFISNLHEDLLADRLAYWLMKEDVHGVIVEKVILEKEN